MPICLDENLKVDFMRFFFMSNKYKWDNQIKML